MTRKQAQSELTNLLRNLSEKATFAQWYGDLEFIIWDRLDKGPSRFGQLELTEDLLRQLSALSQQVGGWVFYRDEADEEDEHVRFIDILAWSDEFQEWLSRVPEEYRPRDR